MKKLLLLLSVFVLIVIPSNAHAVRITSSPTSATAKVGDTVSYVLTIGNDLNVPSSFVISVFGPHLEWMSLEEYYLKIDKKSSRDTSLLFYPNSEGVYQYKVRVSSVEDPTNSDTINIYLDVKSLKDPGIKSFSSKLSRDKLNLYLNVNSERKRDIKILFEVINSEGNRVKSLEIGEELKGSKSIEESIYVGDLEAGVYTVKASLIGFNIYEETSFRIEPVHNVLKIKRIRSNPFSQEVILTIENKGNIIEDYLVREALPFNQPVTFIENPDSYFLENGKNMVYQWNLRGLMIGKPVEIKYRIEYWPSYVVFFIIGICVLGLLGVSVLRISKPSIEKRYVKKRENEHLIILEVKGSVTKELRNVLVKDSVSPLAKVEEQFEGPRPIVRVSESGTELIWRLGDVKPRSDVLLSYRIKPFIEASLKMPRAHLTYRTPEGKRFRVYSKRIVLK
jgi:hypothetical protein